jgi:hydroxymethylglutaryl-CoA lyase
LQNEKTVLSIETRLEFAERLAAAGVTHIELGAFVSPQWVPQMAGSPELMKSAFRLQNDGKSPLKTAKLSALVPNPRGMQDALDAGVKRVAIFGSASEAFSKKNINCSIEESFQRFAKVMELAKANGVKVRGYLSMCFGCPFEGDVAEGQVVRLVKRMVHMGMHEVSIGDTIGVANPAQVRRLVAKLIDAVGEERLAMHFHDTRGTALANVLASLDLGIRTFDSSLGGLGGCPYAPAATGNLATEDVVFMLHGMGYHTGINLEALPTLNKWICEQVGHALPSRVGRAGLPHLIPV